MFRPDLVLWHCNLHLDENILLRHKISGDERHLTQIPTRINAGFLMIVTSALSRMLVCQQIVATTTSTFDSSCEGLINGL